MYAVQTHPFHISTFETDYSKLQTVKTIHCPTLNQRLELLPKAATWPRPTKLFTYTNNSTSNIHIKVTASEAPLSSMSHLRPWKRLLPMPSELWGQYPQLVSTFRFSHVVPCSFSTRLRICSALFLFQVILTYKAIFMNTTPHESPVYQGQLPS